MSENKKGLSGSLISSVSRGVLVNGLIIQKKSPYIGKNDLMNVSEVADVCVLRKAGFHLNSCHVRTEKNRI